MNGSSNISSPIPSSRPNLVSIGRSSSSRTYGEDDFVTDSEATRTGDESDTVENVLKKLEIEKRVQFGAERMLHVIESGEAEGGDKPDVKTRISAQLSESNAKIRALETQLEKMRRATPQRSRRRQPLMNAFGNGSSTQPSSLGSTYIMGQGQMNRSRMFPSSSLTPERLPPSDLLSYQSSSTLASGSGSSSHQSPYSKARARSYSTGEDSFGHAHNRDPLVADSVSIWDSPAKGNWTANAATNSPDQVEEHDEDVADQLKNIHHMLLRLQALAEWSREQSNAQWKGKQVDRGDEAWDVIQGVAGILKQSSRTRREAPLEDLMKAVLHYLGDSVASRLRAASYRLLRYLIVDRSSWHTVLDNGVEWMLIRSFTRETKHHVAEKEQALRLMRCGLLLPSANESASTAADDDPFAVNGNAISTSPASITTADLGGSRSVESHSSRRDNAKQSDAPTSSVAVSGAMIRALVSAAENSDDSLQAACIETLMEIAIIDVERLLQSSALRVLLACFKDGPSELCPAMTHILMYLANSPTTRRHLLPQADVETVLVGLTEPHAVLKNGAHVEKFRECARNVGLLLKSWTGLLFLCQNDRRSIKSLVGSLRVPVVELRAVILDLMFDILRIKAPNWMDAFLDGRRLTVYNRTREASTQLDEEPDGEMEEPERPTLVDNYISFLLLVLLDAGLLEALLDVVEEDNHALTRKSTLLMGEILRMSNKLLPLQYASQIQALPRLFELSMQFETPESRHIALSALSSIDSLTRNLARPAARVETRNATRKRSNSVQDPLQRGQRQVQQVKMRMGMQIDDKHFAMLINDTQVVQGRDHTKWNYEILLEVIEGPLLNPKRLEEVIKVSKFMRRLFSFFHPHNQRFSAIQRTRPNQKWVKLARALLTTMLANPDGIRYLQEDKLLRQIVDCFSELDQYAGQFSAQPLFARNRIESTLTYGYFEMIGTLTKHTEGMKLLEKFRFFTSFYHLSELRSRDDIIRATIENFDYTIDGHQRIVLSKALTSNYMETRLFATHTLGSLLEDPVLSAWALRLMLTQLYDPAMEVCDAAVLYLEEACASTETLEMVVNMRPSLEHLGEVGHPLFMRFVSTSVGFSYLHQAEYIDRELDEWFLTRNLLYVVEAETFVSKTLCPISTDTVEDYWFYEGTAPTHFYGEITKTAAGCQTLRDKGHFERFAEIIRDHGLESEDGRIIDTLKSVLWAVGNIGSTAGGLPFLEGEEILGSIVEIAEESHVLTVKGTCFFVLGLISSTEQGAELLEEYGWIATRTPMGFPTGICLPLDISKFSAIMPWQRASRPADQPLPPPDNELEIEVMTAISNLANYMLSTGAMNWLKRLRKDHAHLFSSPSLFYRAIAMISSNHYRAPVRSFIFDLFDIKLSASAVADLVRTREELQTRRVTTTSGMGSDLLEVPKPAVSVSTVGNGPPGRSRALTVSSAGSTEGPAKAVRLEPRQRQTGFVLPGMESADPPQSPDVRAQLRMPVGEVMS